jgi:hypothetical protein
MSKRQPTCFPQSSFNEKEKHEATEQTLQKLARDGLIVDTGRRRWSKRTRSYQIVWTKAPGAKFAHLTTHHVDLNRSRLQIQPADQLP